MNNLSQQTLQRNNIARIIKMKPLGRHFTILLLLLVFLFNPCNCIDSEKDYTTANAWRKRSIYQLMIDRFNNPQRTNCTYSASYCGGNWNGVVDSIGYIRGMNFDAVWISPHTTNTPQGYHGYWPDDLYTPNPFFGSTQDMQDALHSLFEAGFITMLDVVLNHMGYGSSYPSFNYYYNPFNQATDFNNCTGCPPGCTIPQPPSNGSTTPEFYRQLYDCQLSNLPDLNHSNPVVVSQFLNWARYLKDTFHIHGIRYDAITFFPPSFLGKFADEINMYGLGETFYDVGSPVSYDIIQKQLQYGETLGNVSLASAKFSILDFSYAFALRFCFAAAAYPYGDPNLGCRMISKVRKDYQDMGADQSIMGRFIDNHDIPRFLR